jgi:myo-inositol 2-dehydrogenase/D-chiro-inositol 1-dehydrogenase
MDLLAHDIDYARWVIGDECESVYAVGNSSTEELAACNVHDNATVMMTFKKGSVLTLSMSRNATYGYDQRCEFFGTDGIAKVENIHRSSAEIGNASGVHNELLQYSFPQRFDGAFRNEMNAFADVILEGKEWSVKAQDCIQVSRIALAADLSCKIGSIVKMDDLEKTLAAEDNRNGKSELC